MVTVPGFAQQVQWVVAVDPAEQLVQLGGHQELPVGHHLEQAELGLGEGQHLVANQGQTVVVVGVLLLDEFETWEERERERM